MARDDNALAYFIKGVRRYAWKAAGKKPIADVMDTFDALGFETRNSQKPVLAHHHQTPSGWHLVINLPAGISSADVLSKLDHFREQTGSTVTMKPRGAKLHIDVHTNPLPDNIPFTWDQNQYTSMDLPIPIGYTAAGLQAVDLARLPHLFAAGNTGGGKTTFLRTLAVALIQAGAWVVIIDLKKLDFAFLNQHALVADTELAASATLAALNNEMDRRTEILKRAGATKLQEYDGDLPWVVCIIDELGELREKEDQEALNRLARLSRATGICLVAATQRPSHTLFRHFTDTRMLFAGRICFSVPKQEDSRLILDSDSAYRISPDLKGRAIWQWGEEVEVQCMNLPIKDAKRIVAQLPPLEVRIGEPRSARLLPR